MDWAHNFTGAKGIARARWGGAKGPGARASPGESTARVRANIAKGCGISAKA